VSRSIVIHPPLSLNGRKDQRMGDHELAVILSKV